GSSEWSSGVPGECGASGSGVAAGSFSGVSSTSVPLAASSVRSGTSHQCGSSSYGSDATTVPPPVRVRYHRVSPQAVAVTVSPLVSSRLSRAPGAAAATSRTVSASACPSSSPARSRASTSAHTNAESLRASSDSTSSAGRDGTSGASEPGQPGTAPLWLNSHVPAANGAAAASASAPERVASRTAASSARVRTTRARSAKDRSAQTGPARRYRAGTGSPSAYQPTPKPSALTVPYRCRRGAQDCRYRPCGGATSRPSSASSGPTYAI